MSALWAPSDNWTDGSEQTDRTRLRAVAPSPARLARFPFLVVLIGIFGVGMGGLLMLNTTLQNQAFEARALSRTATELAYQQSDLENQLDAQSAPQELARRASALGMRANPYPAFLVLPSGKVIGKAEPVTGSEVPSLIVKTPAEIEADKIAAAAKKEAAAAKKKAEAEQKAAEAKQKAADAKAKAAEQKKKAEAQAKADAKKSGPTKTKKKPAGGN